jgi:transcriptional regulator with XRE-family HTH domain
MTQEEVAQLVEVSQNTVSSWELDRHAPPLSKLRALSDVLGTSREKLLSALERTIYLPSTGKLELSTGMGKSEGVDDTALLLGNAVEQIFEMNQRIGGLIDRVDQLLAKIEELARDENGARSPRRAGPRAVL